ncbi:hypothetical protein [Pseudaminobacter sp. NGMCC 1.201702]|uniref:hypothetical protein n=1 Tax=Pseudaminobacter sp. NGMCC 1.201702 TaxID=3391825 RepID=UPI0039EFC366
MPHSATLQARLQKVLGELPPRIADLFAPHPWPSADILALARLMATEAGIPEKCGRADCRRAGRCRAAAIGKAGPACGAHWSDAELARLEAAAEGMVFAHLLAERRATEMRKVLAP